MNASTAWSALASRWDELFPLRPARVAMCREGLGAGASVLDAGCGSGSLVESLLPLGLEAFGFDLDEGFVERARRRTGERVVRADLREVGEVHPGRRFDRIVCLGQTFPHLLEDDDVESFLAGARSRLVEDGSLLLQVVNDEGAPSERRLPVLEASGLRLERRRILSGPGRALLELRAEVGGESASWTVEHRRWVPEALADAGRRCGFRPAGVRSDEAGAPWTGREAGWILELSAA